MSKYDVHAYRKKTGGGFKQIPESRVVAWIERNFDFKKRKGGAEYCINSPFDGDAGYNFNINPEKGVCHDWRGDEWAGPINPETGKRNCSFIKFVRLHLKCTYKEALQEVLGATEDVSGYMRPEGRVTDREAKKKVSVALPDGVRFLAESKDRQASSLRKWLGTRGYTPEGIAKNELCYLAMDVYWPYYEFDTLVYWQSRSRLNKRFNFPQLEIYDEFGKVVGITDGSKGDFLYGFDDIESASYLIITEAIFDKNTLGEQSLASGGAILTENQIKKLRILGPRNGIILSPDNDKAGIKSLVTNTVLLERQGFKVFYSLPPKIKYEVDGEEKITKDWNELGQFVVGFENVRQLHDEQIKPASKKNLVELRSKINVEKNRRNFQR